MTSEPSGGRSMASQPLRGRTVIVTGAARVVGAAVARALGGAGAGVVIAAPRAPEELVAQIGAAGGQAIAVSTDLADPVSVRRLVEQTLGAFGRLDAACNTAACHVVGCDIACIGCCDIACCGDAALDRDGTRGLALAMRYEIASMRPGGSIVNLAPTPAVIELTRTAARDHAGSGIRVNAVTAGSAEQVAEAVVWLCSDDAAHVTGAALPPSHGPDSKSHMSR